MLSRRALVWGGVFGLIAPFIGLFIGLQISVGLANILLFPVIMLSVLIHSPFGTWGVWLMLLGLVASVLVWALLFALVHMLFIKRG